MKIKKEVINITIFYLFTGLFVVGTGLVYYYVSHGMAVICGVITGAIATIPIHKSNEAAKRQKDKWIKQMEETNWQVGKLRLDDLLENPVIYRQRQSETV